MSNKKYALVTGASTGIGNEISRLLAQDGYNLVLTARSAEKLNELKVELEEKYNIYAKVIVKDLSSSNASLEIYNEIASENISISVLINNAGFAVYGKFIENELQTELDMIQVNILALTTLTKLFANEMALKGGGKILNVASTAAFQPGPLMAIYYATKSYVLHFTEALANELKEQNIIISALCPGATKTEFQERANLNESRLFNNPLVMSAEEVAKIGYDGLKEGKTVIIPGKMNKLLAFGTRLTPRKITAILARKIQEQK